LDVDALGADWYIANLHKWAWTPRSAGFVWVAEAHRAHLHPPVISWGLDNGLAAEFDLVGTRDPTPFLTAPVAVDLQHQWGGPAIVQHNHDLAWRSAHRLAEAWGTVFDTPEEMIGPMASITLPASLGSTKAQAAALQTSLLADDHIEVPIAPSGDSLRVRICAQIYNDDRDYERLAEAITRRC
jgi:isopenicillin-N epimerase